MVGRTRAYAWQTRKEAANEVEDRTISTLINVLYIYIR